ncbi:hypothetical protein [Alloactinosynnema sp. L-07]|uniref:hypothetical protein n=1 Tax=Alloactinosynnema sp. L-07 TaxID=1653480 RepID=UPI0006B4CCCF|nr:hypothetical protein [Alloactinosynnema sp. L-07]
MDLRAQRVMESKFGWAGGIPQFACRWTIKACTADFRWSTMIFDLLPDRSHVAVYPGAVTTGALLLERSPIEVLATTLDTRETCAVPALHPQHGDRLLNLRPCALPHEPPWTNRPADSPPYLGPMELVAELPKDPGIRVVFRHDRVQALEETLAEIVQASVSGHPRSSTAARRAPRLGLPGVPGRPG